jgi:hypothetical protein
MIHVTIDGEKFGQIDPEELTIDDQIALEDARGAKALIAWLTQHAGTTDEQAATIGKMKLRKVKELSQAIGDAITAALELPN